MCTWLIYVSVNFYATCLSICSASTFQWRWNICNKGSINSLRFNSSRYKRPRLLCTPGIAYRDIHRLSLRIMYIDIKLEAVAEPAWILNCGTEVDTVMQFSIKFCVTWSASIDFPLDVEPDADETNSLTVRSIKSLHFNPSRYKKRLLQPPKHHRRSLRIQS